MRRLGVAAVAGVVLIVFGLLFLLGALGIVRVGVTALPVFFGLGGLVFLYVFFANRANWWALIPGLTLLGLAGLIAWGEFGPQDAEAWGPVFFLLMIALSFWLIYALNPENWWAVIPGGVLTTVALVVGLSSVFAEGPWLVGVFFLGLSVTFGLLWLLPSPQGRLKWALIPAAVPVSYTHLTLPTIYSV